MDILENIKIGSYITIVDKNNETKSGILRFKDNKYYSLQINQNNKAELFLKNNISKIIF